MINPLLKRFFELEWTKKVVKAKNKKKKKNIQFYKYSQSHEFTHEKK